MTPAETVIAAFNGVTPLAEAIGIHRVTIHRWNKIDKRRAHRLGIIPQKYYESILAAAFSRGIRLTPEQLMFGQREVRVIRQERRAGSSIFAMAASLAE